MKRKITINYNWQSDVDSKAKIKKSHQGALEESAVERISDMMKQGYSSGELFDNISMDDEDGRDGVSYSGWWEVQKK